MTETEFKQLAQEGYNRIPLVAEAFADLETPLSLYLKLAHVQNNGERSFLLESVVGGERFGRYSFIGLPARTLLRASGFGSEAKTEVVTDGIVVETHAGNPLDFVADYQSVSRWRCVKVCRVFAAAWRAILVTTRCVTSKRNWPIRARRMTSACPTSCCCKPKSWR